VFVNFVFVFVTFVIVRAGRSGNLPVGISGNAFKRPHVEMQPLIGFALGGIRQVSAVGRNGETPQCAAGWHRERKSSRLFGRRCGSRSARDRLNYKA